jgi:hypothetical protein
VLGHAVTNIPIFSRHQLSAFADDICTVARNPRALTDAFNELGTAPTNIGLQVNTSKNETPGLYTKKATLSEALAVEKHIFGKPSVFKFLGVLVATDNVVTGDI